MSGSLEYFTGVQQIFNHICPRKKNKIDRKVFQKPQIYLS